MGCYRFGENYLYCFYFTKYTQTPNIKTRNNFKDTRILEKN